jgi:HK97 family phage prohead protease
MKYFLNIKSIKSVDTQDTTQEKKVWRIIASSESVDRAGDKILLSAWDLKNFLKNPIILFGHDSWSLENAIGKAIYIEITDKELIIDVVFSETNSKGQTVEAMLQEGMSLGASVGYIEKESKMEGDVKVITKAELVELSVVLLGCNPDAGIKIKNFAQEKNIEMNIIYEILETEKAFITKSEEKIEAKNETEIVNEVVDEKLAEAETITEESKVEEEVVDTETEKQEIQEEENEIEIEEEVVDKEVEIEVEEDEKSFEIEIDTENKSAIIEKEGRRLSNATIEKISQVKAIATDLQEACKGLIATLDNLIGEGEKELDGYITINSKEINEMREKLRTSNRAESDVLSKLNNLLN